MNGPRILISVETSHGHGRSIIEGATRYIVEQGGSIDFEGHGLLDEAPRWLPDWKGDGILIRCNQPSACRILQKSRIPYVQLYCKNDEDGYDVGCDEGEVGRLAVRHFLEQGHRHFAMVSHGEFHWAALRERGFVDALEERGSSCSVFHAPTACLEPLTLWNARDRRRLGDWLKKQPKPLALFTLTDMHSRRIVDLCKDRGISVPEQIAVLGVDNDQWFCRHNTPTLSSIDQNGGRIGYEAAALLFRRIRGERRSSSPLLVPPAGLAQRASTDTLAIDDPDLVLAAGFIRNRREHLINVEDVVHEVGLSRRTLERKFFKQFGRTIGQEINRIRMVSAVELLRETTIPIGTIARRCGFGTHGYFVSAFQKAFQMSPTEYRRQHAVGKQEKNESQGAVSK